MLHSSKEFVYFSLCPETLNEVELKKNGFLNLLEGIPREHSIQAMTWLFCCLLLRRFTVEIRSKEQDRRF
jgi:hypothetical protein